jgi:hypothetical protein
MRSIVRSLLRLALAAGLCLVCVVSASAQEAPADQPDQPDQSDQPADVVAPPSGPVIQPMDPTPVICDPNTAGFRYLELRGSGFDAWAGQRLAGSTLDAGGNPLVQWNSVWVSPQGQLTVVLNLCADPYRGRPALPAGTYTVAVGTGGRAIAATSFDLSPPPDTSVDADQVAPTLPVQATVTPAPSATPATPFVNQQPTATPFPTYTLPTLPNSTPTPVPTPRSGPGTQDDPFPIGMPGLLADGWQMVVTGVTPDAWTGIHNAVPSNTQAPSSDQRDFEVRVQATYQGQYTGVFSGMRLALIGPNGVMYDQIHNNCGTLPDSVPPNLVTPGGVTRGNVCFVVRATDIPFLVLADNQVVPNDRQFFAVH